MKYDIRRVDYSNGPSKSGNWWSWVEYCDCCGLLIRNRNVITSEEPDCKEADFCSDCIKNFLAKGLSYLEAEKIYKSGRV